MSFSPEIFEKKLDSLQETQDLIVSISQWVLFHHRHAHHLCDLWSKYVLTNPNAQTLKKKLSLLYLCNDVVQQARHKRKPDFSAGFAKILPNALRFIYSSVDEKIKPKVERLISVWSERNIFTGPQIHAMKRSLALDSDAVADAPVRNGDPGDPKVATDLVHLNNLYTHMTQLKDLAQSNLSQIGQQSKMYLPDDPLNLDNLPLPKVYVSKLNILEKLCNMTVKNIEDTKKDRQDIVAVLQNLQKLVLEGSETDESKLAILRQRLDKIHDTKSELLEMIDEPVPSKPLDTQPEVVEEPSPTFDSNTLQSLASDNSVPTYEDSSDSDEDSTPIPAVTNSVRKRPFDEPESLPKSLKKSVAFSEDVEVKEYEREEQTDVYQFNETYNDNMDLLEGDDFDNAKDFEQHHKDALELKHERDGSLSPMGADNKSGLLDLLSKLN